MKNIKITTLSSKKAKQFDYFCEERIKNLFLIRCKTIQTTINYKHKYLNYRKRRKNLI